MVAGQTIDPLEAVGTWPIIAPLAVLLEQEILLSDMLNGLRCNYLMNPWRQVWHFLRLVVKPDGMFCISNTFPVVVVLTIDHVLDVFNDSEEVPLGCSEVVL
jgi:hypothetical protein